jgi:hypothetical protein
VFLLRTEIRQNALLDACSRFDRGIICQGGIQFAVQRVVLQISPSLQIALIHVVLPGITARHNLPPLLPEAI